MKPVPSEEAIPPRPRGGVRQPPNGLANEGRSTVSQKTVGPGFFGDAVFPTFGRTCRFATSRACGIMVARTMEAQKKSAFDGSACRASRTRIHCRERSFNAWAPIRYLYCPSNTRRGDLWRPEFPWTVCFA